MHPIAAMLAYWRAILFAGLAFRFPVFAAMGSTPSKAAPTEGGASPNRSERP